MPAYFCAEEGHHALESADLPLLFERICQRERLANPSRHVHWRMGSFSSLLSTVKRRGVYDYMFTWYCLNA